MSTEEQNQPEQKKTEAGQPVVEEVVEKVTEAAEAAEKQAKASIGQIVSQVMDLKQKNPKVFFGGIGVAVVLIGYLMFSGNPEVISKASDKQLTVGQSYILKTPNSAGENPKVRLVSTPGEIKAYDDTEETDREGCKNVDAGTTAVVKGLFDAFGKKGAFAKVEITSGPCQGKEMWTLSVNVQ